MKIILVLLIALFTSGNVAIACIGETELSQRTIMLIRSGFVATGFFLLGLVTYLIYKYKQKKLSFFLISISFLIVILVASTFIYLRVNYAEIFGLYAQCGYFE